MLFVWLFLITTVAGPLRAEPRHYLIPLNDANRLELHVYKTGLYHGKISYLPVSGLHGND